VTCDFFLMFDPLPGGLANQPEMMKERAASKQLFFFDLF